MILRAGNSESPPISNCDDVCEVMSPRKLIRDLAPRIFIIFGAAHVGTPYLAQAKIPDPQEESKGAG